MLSSSPGATLHLLFQIFHFLDFIVEQLYQGVPIVAEGLVVVHLQHSAQQGPHGPLGPTGVADHHIALLWMSIKKCVLNSCDDILRSLQG